jgi:hypothetical protein
MCCRRGEVGEARSRDLPATTARHSYVAPPKISRRGLPSRGLGRLGAPGAAGIGWPETPELVSCRSRESTQGGNEGWASRGLGQPGVGDGGGWLLGLSGWDLGVRVCVSHWASG